MEEVEVIKKKYELSYLLREEADLADLRRLLVQHGGEVEFESQSRKIPLAYDIRRAKEACFGFINFSMKGEEAKRLEADLRTNPKVLRSLIIDLAKERGSSKEIHRERVARPSPQRSAPRFETAKKPQPTVSNEALEKKIEEILK